MIIVGFVQQLLELVVRELAARLQFEGSFELFIRYRAAPILIAQIKELLNFAVADAVRIPIGSDEGSLHPTSTRLSGWTVCGLLRFVHGLGVRQQNGVQNWCCVD